MDAETILEIKPALTLYLSEFDGCFSNRASTRRLRTYVTGQLSDLDRKSVEPMADAAGESPRSLQEFLSQARWDEGAARDRLQRRVARRHADPNSLGVIDETGMVKKGDQTACVQQQHCGSVGKVENCVVSVHLGYAAGEFHTLLDGELYLPKETWHPDRERCRAAGIPDEGVYRPKWQMALEQYRRAVSHGVRFAWLPFDEGHGGKPAFMRELDGCGQNYVGEIPVSLVGWTVPPEILHRNLGREGRMGRPRKVPRLKVRHTPACEVRDLLKSSPLVRRQPWMKYRVMEGEKGSMVWEAKGIPLWIKDEGGLPVGPYHLLIARSVMNPEEVKFFLSNAPPLTSVKILLLVAFSRWRIERMFEDSKGELGLDPFEVRKYPSIQRHLILTCISHLFLAEFCLERQKKRNGPDGLPGSNGDAEPGSPVEPRRTMLSRTSRGHRGANEVSADPKRRRPKKSPETNHPRIVGSRRQTERLSKLSMAEEVASWH